MHRSLLGFSLCSGISNCWRKRALRARAGLSQRTVSSVCGSRCIRSIFSLVHRQECSSGQCVHLRAVCPRHLLNIWGSTWEEPWLYLSIPSPWRLSRLQLQKQNEVKVSSGVSSRTTGEGAASAPTSFAHPSLGKRYCSCVSTEPGEEPSHIWHHWLHLHQETEQGQGTILALASDCPYHRVLSMVTAMILVRDS